MFNRCIVCDIAFHYINKGGTCQKISLDNCKFFNFNLECIYCSGNQVIDHSTKKCRPIPRGRLVKKCIRYSSDSKCLYCEEQFFLRDNLCVAAPSPIKNCKIYLSEGVCHECYGNYLLNYQRTACVDQQLYNKEIPGCSNIKKVSCQKCKASFFNHEDLYHKNVGDYLSQLQTNQGFLIEHMRNQEKDKLFFKIHREVCFAHALPHCEQQLSFSVCLRCSRGFFLAADSSCQPDVLNRIDNCLHYLSAVECGTCSLLFHPSRDKK
jgi:hypothetical protein